MKNQKTFKVETWGLIPTSVQSIIDSIKDKPVSKEAIFVLNKDIEFCVCNLRAAHGNLNEVDGSAWLSPNNGYHSYNVSIKF
jgi:hypothetical protein